MGQGLTIAPWALFTCCSHCFSYESQALIQHLGDTPENPLFQENTHHCWVSQAGSREQDPGFNCKPAACGQVCFPLLQSRPLLLGKSHTKVTISQEQRRVPDIRMLGEEVSRLQESWHGCYGMPATPQHPQPAAATTAGDIPGPSDSVLLRHSRAAGRAFSLNYPHNYSQGEYPSARLPSSPKEDDRSPPPKAAPTKGERSPLSHRGLGQDVSYSKTITSRDGC